MKTCVCGKYIPTKVTIDGKERNLQNRRKCLDCFPFGTKHVYSKKSPDEVRSYNAKKAQNWRKRKMDENGGKDPINIIRVEKKARVVNAIGGACQVCGYSKLFNNLVFHHTGNKSFELDSRRFQYAMNKLLDEIEKCVLICHNCHGEVHANLIDEELVAKCHQHFQDREFFFSALHNSVRLHDLIKDPPRHYETQGTHNPLTISIV